MILPIYAYGHPVLKKRAKPVSSDYPELEELINNMWETMYNAQGVGLAAPQVGTPLRIFVIDTEQLEEEEKEFKGIKKVFINPLITDLAGDPWEYEEGCLSIPDIRGKVEREFNVELEYEDESFNLHTVKFKGVNGRVVLHEYDHLEGILFTDKISPLKRRMIKRKLEKIKKGKVTTNYKMKFAK